ncbi:sacsin N-terminal ATP-binding-like domain-containing protein [Streptomyces sp. NPDC059247]|uniref:sacsin N-terminal ATP-binding-like domain-containing protein n=1 Tax=Streptomyces sp. NPDC059247 TaxID=3346790 RepID=UPI003698477D
MARQVDAATDEFTKAYTGRFLLELLQNAYDAHPRGSRGGRVHVLLDEDEGEWGTLYVANGGDPFTWENVNQVCELARSSKVIGEGIGNKGVGFRSVLLVSEAPEIYSTDPDGPGGPELDGYCFRFASRRDLEEFLAGDEDAHEVAAAFPLLQAPLPVAEVPPVCRELAARGNVTVVRLPLLEESARVEARNRLEELARAKVPVMLFLDRLSSLTLERRAEGGTVRDLHEFTRSEKRFAPRGTAFGSLSGYASVSCATVDLGPSGKFLVSRRTVDHDRLAQTLRDAVAARLLNKKWEKWTEPAVVEVAVPLDTEHRNRRGRFYTFLPMGDETSFFPGHVNAPFFTRTDRAGLPRENPLNALLLDVVAETCLAAAAVLRQVPRAPFRQLAVDLVSWDSGRQSAGRLATASRHLYGCEVSALPLVPVLTAGDAAPGKGWASAREALLWPDLDLAVLTAYRACDAGAVVADPRVGADRLHRLEAMCKSLGCSWAPKPQTLADHAERIAGALPLPGSELEKPDPAWSALYEDLAILFAEDGRVLRGRKLLLTKDGKVERANGEAGGTSSRSARGRREAFFPPVAAEQAGIPPVPAQLRGRLVLLHPGVAWSTGKVPGQRVSARVFLSDAELVRPFDVTSLLTHVRRALSESTDRRLRLSAVRFVFQLWRTQRALGGTKLAALGLYVPTADGRMIRASSAFFGKGWTGTAAGEDLADVASAGQKVSTSLKSIAQRLIAAPGEFVRKDESSEEWRMFLAESGVNDGLAPVHSPEAVTREKGRELVTRRLVRMAKVTHQVQAQWEPHIDRAYSAALYPQTPYQGTPAYQLPGQDIVGQLGDHARLAYARLILQGLARWANARFTSVWTSDGSQRADKETVMTPLAAFIREQPWLPVRGRDRAVRFVRPADVWHCPEGMEEEPSFVLTVDHRVRHLLAPERVRTRLREMRMPTWDNPRDSVRVLAALGRLVEEGALDDEDRAAVQRANERAWQTFVGQPNAALPAGISLLVETGNQLAAVATATRDEDAVLYVGDERDSLKALLVREMKYPLLIAPGVAADAAGHLGRSWPHGTVRRLADLTFRVRIDGKQVDPAAEQEAIVDHLPWLPLAVTVLADHTTAGPRASESELGRMTAAVQRVRLRRYRSWEIELDGRAVTMPDRLEGVLPLADPEHPLILALEADPHWGEVPRLVEALTELIGHPGLGYRLSLAVYRLAAVHADLHNPAEDELAEALKVTLLQLQETRGRVDGAIGMVLKRCYPFLVHALGADVARTLTVPAPLDTTDFQAILEEHAGALPLPPQEFISQARAARGLDDLRIRLGVGFAGFNTTLQCLAPGHEPVSHAKDHEEALHTYLDLHRKGLVNRLRWAVKDDFDARRPIRHWPSLRDLDWITVPEAWAHTVETADSARLEELVEEQLTHRLDRPAPHEGERLPDRDQVRGANNRAISAVASDLAALVKATGRRPPTVLTEADPADEVTALLDGAGALDFRQLSPDEIIGWLNALGGWPEGMPLTMEPGRHGLTASDLDRVRDEAANRRRERERSRETIRVGGRDFHVPSGDFSELTAELQGHLDAGLRPRGRAVFTYPQAPEPSKGSSGPGTGRAGRYDRADTGLSQAQRDAIGYMGEWYAYHWLLANEEAATDESIWVSTNRRKAFPGLCGDNSLGFDFSVGSGKQPRLFEVKATQGEGGRIDLGETEVRAAQRYAGSDRWRLLIVTHVNDPERVSVSMLPNPFGKHGRGCYREEGGALRFSYRK